VVKAVVVWRVALCRQACRQAGGQAVQHAWRMRVLGRSLKAVGSQLILRGRQGHPDRAHADRGEHLRGRRASGWWPCAG
jgi:hypothetical protein